MRGSVLIVLALAFFAGGCAFKGPVKAYHFLYCDQMNADKVHCDRWATPNGKLHP